MPLKIKNILLEMPLIYDTWQSLFKENKIAPFVENCGALENIKVLDIGCGPAIYSYQFKQCDYTGIDINPEYINWAKSKYPEMNFIAMDATDIRLEPGVKFDLILINSLLHHIDLEGIKKILTKSKEMLTEDGVVHIIEQAKSPNNYLIKFMTALDRGGNALYMEEWRDLFNLVFKEKKSEPFFVSFIGINLWQAYYYKGVSR